MGVFTGVVAGMTEERKAGAALLSSPSLSKLSSALHSL